MREDELKLLKQMDPTDLINSTLKFQTLGMEDEWKLTLGIHLFPVLVSRLGSITDSSSPSPGETADILHHYTIPLTCRFKCDLHTAAPESRVELPTNLREISKCQEKFPTRTFSLLPTNFSKPPVPSGLYGKMSQFNVCLPCLGALLA